jgi:hypothetical protein
LHLLRSQFRPLSFNINELRSGSLLHNGSRRRRRRAHSVRHGAEIFSLGTTGSSHGRLLLLMLLLLMHLLLLLLLSWRRRSLGLIGTDTHGHRSKVFSFRTPTGTDLLLLLLLHLLRGRLLWLLLSHLLRNSLLSSLCCHQRSRRLAGAGHRINLVHLFLRWLHLLLLRWLHLLLLRWLHLLLLGWLHLLLLRWLHLLFLLLRRLLLLLRGSSCFLTQAPLHYLQGLSPFAWWTRHDDD